ncbi:thioredoxin reductase 1, cytoplasmic-like [Clytia hemisphaerica]|uniref:thioredoxin-disulfide reductase (NADPH) n=1 Tax=Clytia hemisphaerica TaxID=252671 RepID=A0A7M5WQ22_9CNID|eukprot:TCONS_00032105-protein
MIKYSFLVREAKSSLRLFNSQRLSPSIFTKSRHFSSLQASSNKCFETLPTRRNFLDKRAVLVGCLHTTGIKMAPIDSINQLVESHNKENKVMIWSKSYCPFCKKVKEIFNNINQPYKAYELDLEANGAEIQEALLAKTGQKTVPNVFVANKHLGGASDTEAAFKEGRLTQLLSGDDKEYDYDLFVVGGGSGGLACSKEAVKYGAKVAVADFVKPTPKGSQWGIGGTCVNVGCIPKKLMHQAALLGESLTDAKAYGWSTPEKNTHNWETMVQAIQDHIRSLNWGYKVQLRQQNVKYYNKYASLVDKNTLKLVDRSGKEETVTARNIVLATGGRPIYPDVPGAKECCITSDDIFSLPYAPGKTLFIGASYISLECAGFLHGLGYDTTVMVRSILLRGFDQEMANRIGDYMEQEGIKFLKGYNIVKFEKLEEGTPGKVRVTYKNAEDKIESAEYDSVVLAVGRKPLIDDVGVQNAGVQLHEKSGFVITDNADRTNVDNIYCIGDLAEGKPELTPVAIQAGRLLAKRIFAGAQKKCDYENVATTVFTPLEYGACGLSEEDAIKKYGDENVTTYHSNFTPLEATVAHRLDNGCYAKLICNKTDDERVIGMHVVGPNAGEMIQGFALAFKTGATKEHFDDLIGIHPTNAEIFTTLDKTKAEDPAVTGC